MEDKNISFNLFLGEDFNKLISSTTNQAITKDLFSTTDKDFVVLNNNLALPELIQKFLDDIIYDKKEIVERINRIFSLKPKYNLAFYKKLFENDLFPTIMSSNYDYILEDNFSSLISKNTPFSVNNDGSNKKTFYKIYGDFKDRDRFIISTQDIKRVKMLDFYSNFWNKIREEFKKRETILFGVNLNDRVFLDILDFILSKIPNNSVKPIYFYSNQASDKILNDANTANFIKKYSVEIINGENDTFFETVNTKFAIGGIEAGDANQENYA